MKGHLVATAPLPPVIDTLLPFCVAIEPRPRLPRAPAAVVASVPPQAMGTTLAVATTPSPRLLRAPAAVVAPVPPPATEMPCV